MLFQRECLLINKIVLLVTCVFFFGCNHKTYKFPDGYDLSKPQKMELGKGLVEISGIMYYEENGNLMAVSDSKRNIFEINFIKRKLNDLTDKVVPPDSDLEEITASDSSFYLLSSLGTIYEVPKTAKDSNGVKTYTLQFQGQNDFETVYYDPTAKGLVMICKSCAFEKGKHSKSAFRFDLSTKKFDSIPFFNIDTKDIKKILKDDNANFDPSAAAIHPINKRLYLLSSAGNLLVVTDTRGKVIEAYNLNPDEFPQAEGIAFASNGDMYITNEGKYGKANLLIFSYKNHDKKK